MKNGDHMSVNSADQLNNHHRDTLEQIFHHPASGNIEWKRVVSLFESLGSVVERHDGRFEFDLGQGKQTFDRPHGKDIDVQNIVDFRTMLKDAGFEPEAKQSKES